MVSPENTNYWSSFDYATLINDIPAPDGPYSGFSWPTQPINASSNVFSVDIDGSFEDSDGLKESGSKKRVRSESCNVSSSKACREKLRRDRLNEKFMELTSILEPERPPKTDKAAILVDAVRMVTQLRGEAQKLKDSNSSLHDRIKELKAEKNELRDEKQRLKAEKEKLEQQLKAMNAQPGFMPPAPAFPTAFATAQGQVPGNKLVPFFGYPGVAMWQFMPPASVDTSEDHVLRPPVA
ncbi:transcription factor ILR3-like [Gossypium australe]|uniref:Transcription factor ILR3-like n=1 Tax=Gossypium australe TaxID=47621 RepID=A0A5B6VU33_9ROSI|nr:transcription factor ILR3-like [Gossypium australe]